MLTINEGEKPKNDQI